VKRALNLFVAIAALILAAPALADPAIAIIVSDQVALRPAPRDSAKPHALLWQGEALEVRGERMDYLQVYDHRLERGGFVSAKSVRRVSTEEASAPQLLAVIRFLRETPGAEALGIAYSALYVQAASAQALRGADGAEVFDALGTFAERLARRASSGSATTKASQAALSGHLEIAMSYGVGFRSLERESRVMICYDGDAFRRLIDLGRGDALQRAHAVLALTRVDCIDGDLKPGERRAADEARAELLEAIDVSDLPLYVRNRVHMRRAAVWNSLAFHSARRGEPAQSAAARALQELARVDRHELTDEDQRTYADAAMRVNASRWAALPARPAMPAQKGERPRLVLAKGQPGETCVLLVDAKHEAGNELSKRCTYGIVWEGSATLNREGNALAVAVQHTESWREM
jgi:ADP-ribose pyrophosphatase YjhB (NUDIX family)